MKPLPLIAAAALGAALALAQDAPRSPGAPEATVEALVARLAALRQTSGFRLRASLTLESADSEQRRTRQVLIRGRREGETMQLFYQCLWPPELKGTALRLDRTPGRPLSGFLFTAPDTVTPLTPEHRTQAWLGSDLSVEDLVEDFWLWPARGLEGATNLLAHPCRRVEFRPPAGASAGSTRIQAWIAPDIGVPLLIEKFGADGQLLQRTSVTKVARVGSNQWAAVSAVTETPARHTRTTLVGLSGDHDLTFPAEDFTVEHIQAGLRAEVETVPAR